MTAHAVYDVCKSRELITALNRIETCVSYNEIKCTRSSLAQYALHQSENVGVPIPSHFVSDSFTIASFDNLTTVIDHLLLEQRVTMTQS